MAIDTTHEAMATPKEELERQIMSWNLSKNEREWWVKHEIDALRAENAKQQDEIAEWSQHVNRELNPRITTLESELASLRAVPQDEEVQRIFADLDEWYEAAGLDQQAIWRRYMGARDGVADLSRALAAAKDWIARVERVNEQLEADAALLDLATARAEANAKDAADLRKTLRDCMTRLESYMLRVGCYRDSVDTVLAPFKDALAQAPEPQTCKECHGSGDIEVMTQHLGPDDYATTIECPVCKGTGVQAPGPQGGEGK